MIDHRTIAVTNFVRSRQFYDATLAPRGISRLYADGAKAAGYGREGKAFFWIAEQDRLATQAHVAVEAVDPDAVVASHSAVLASGGRDNGRTRATAAVS